MNFNVLQYLPKNTKIKMDNRLRKTFFLTKSVSAWGKFLSVPLKNISRYINGTRAMPITLLNELINLKGADINKLQDKIELKISKSGNYLKIGPFIDINENWVYVGELIKGDGHIPQNFWNITFVNNNKTLINHVKDFFTLLGIKKNQMMLIEREDANFLIIRSAVLAHLFNKILDIPVGKKSELNIPEFILLNLPLSIAAVRGAFDAEGSVTFTGKGSRRISITSNSKNWLSQIREILEQIRINSIISEDKSKRRIPIYRLLVYRRSNLKRFLKIINPLHPKRREKLIQILNNYRRNPTREFHKRILLSIKNGNIRKRDISKDIKQNLVLVGNNINWLKKKGYIIPFEKVVTNKGSFYKYRITFEGEEYLEKSLSFFD